MKPSLPSALADRIVGFSGRQWVLPPLLQWFSDSHERLFLLTGGPGTGKSMLTAWLAGWGSEPPDEAARAQLGQLRAAVRAAHFCQASSRNISPRAFAENIANQLAATLPGFAGALAATLAGQVQISVTQTIGTVEAGATVSGASIGRIDLGTLGDELSFDRAFTTPLKKLYEEADAGSIILLVDGLDEAQLYRGVTIPDLLSRLADVPRPVRILATTRDEPRVLKFFRDVVPFDLIRKAPADVDDVDGYIQARLAPVVTASESARLAFAQRLAQQAEGIFLYAALVLDELLARPPDDRPDLAAVALPAGLGGLYREFLMRELGKDDRSWFDLYEPLLGVIAVSQGEGLSARQLTEVIGRDVRAALRACKQYLIGELPDGPFRPFHKSFVDFLLVEEPNPDFHIDAATMHRRIAERYRAAPHGRDWSRTDDYGLLHLATHLHALKDDPAFRTVLYGLVDWPFIREKALRHGTHAVMADFELAADAARAEHPANLLQEVRSALAYAALDALATKLPGVLGAVVRRGFPAPALALASRLDPGPFHTAAHCSIARASLERGDRATAEQAWQRAIAEIERIEYVWDRVEALDLIADVAAQAGARMLLTDLVHFAEAIADKGARENALGKLAVKIAEVGDVERASAIARGLDYNRPVAVALAGIATALSKQGALKEAAALAYKAWKAEDKHFAGWVKLRLPQATRSEYSRRHTAVRAEIARALALSIDLDEALAIAKKVDGAYGRRTKALCDIAGDLATAGQREKALRVAAAAFAEAKRIGREWHGWRALADVAQIQARLGQFDQALEAARKAKHPEAAQEALCAIARALAEAGQSQRATQVAHRALAATGKIEEEAARARALPDVASALARAGQNDAVLQTLAMAQAFSDASTRVDALADVARIAASMDDPRSEIGAIVRDVDAWLVPLVEIEHAQRSRGQEDRGLRRV